MSDRRVDRCCSEQQKKQLRLKTLCSDVARLPDVSMMFAAAARGGPVADGGGVRPSFNAEEAGVPQRRGTQAARSADGSG